MIRVINATRRYGTGLTAVAALDSVSLNVAEGEFVALCGPSGCGKSTLLHLIAGLDRADSGEIHVAGLSLHRASESELVRFRRHDVGMVFQFFHLLPTMTVSENVALPLLLGGKSPEESESEIRRVIDLVGLTGRARHFAHQLSGGEMQRASVARALVHQPKILLADEPTGNLDSANADRILALFREIRRSSSAALTTLVLVTHSEQIAATADRVIRLKDGRVLDRGHAAGTGSASEGD